MTPESERFFKNTKLFWKVKSTFCVWVQQFVKKSFFFQFLFPLQNFDKLVSKSWEFQVKHFFFFFLRFHSTILMKENELNEATSHFFTEFVWMILDSVVLVFCLIIVASTAFTLALILRIFDSLCYNENVIFGEVTLLLKSLTDKQWSAMKCA